MFERSFPKSPAPGARNYKSSRQSSRQRCNGISKQSNGAAEISESSAQLALKQQTPTLILTAIMWVGMMQKLKKNRKKFYDEEGKLLQEDLPLPTLTTATAKISSRNSVSSSTTGAAAGGASTTMTSRATPRATGIQKEFNRKKWQRVFKSILKTMRAVGTMQAELKRRRLKGEVEPSPLLSVLSEHSRRACYITERNGTGGVLGPKRVKRPGHSDHAPVLLERRSGGTVEHPGVLHESKEENVGSLRKYFHFSTDVLNHAFRTAVLPVLSKSAENRTTSDIHAVAHILRNLHFFTALEDAQLNYLLGNSRLLHLDFGDVLFKRGDEPEMVYVVLTGTLSVVVRHMGLNFTACDLFSGTSVGEEAVASGKAHKNSVMAMKPTLLLALPRYPELLSRVKRDMVLGKVEFLSNISIFSSLTTPEQLQLLAEQLNVVRVAENTPVCKEGTPITHMLFVKSGHLRTLKVIQHPPPSASNSAISSSGCNQRRPGRNLLIEVQRLAPNNFFGENSFRHMPLNTMRSMRRPGSIRRNNLGTKVRGGENETHTYGTYLASLVSTTYCELYEVPISMVHAIFSREMIATLTEYGVERERLYEGDSLARELVNTLKMNKERKVALTSETYVSRS